MHIKYRTIYLFLLTSVLADEEADINARIERENAKFDDTMRRNENFNDEDWHIAHLKPTDFENTRRSGCKEESFQEKVKKYRRRLKNDPGNIKFVSAAALPVDEKDLVTDTCIPENDNKLSLFKSSRKYKVKKTDAGTDAAKQLNNTSKEAKVRTASTTKIDDKSKEEDKSADPDKKEAKDTATTPKVPGEKKESGGRRGDYLFSSVEYAEDVPEFHYEDCPDTVEVIRLEEDIIKVYDVECELMLLWKSMEELPRN